MKCKTGKCNGTYDGLSAWKCPKCGAFTPLGKFAIAFAVISVPLIVYLKMNKKTVSLSKDQALLVCKSKVESSIKSKLAIGYSDINAYKAGQRTLEACMSKYGYGY